MVNTGAGSSLGAGSWGAQGLPWVTGQDLAARACPTAQPGAYGPGAPGQPQAWGTSLGLRPATWACGWVQGAGHMAGQGRAARSWIQSCWSLPAAGADGPWVLMWGPEQLGVPQGWAGLVVPPGPLHIWQISQLDLLHSTK